MYVYIYIYIDRERERERYLYVAPKEIFLPRRSSGTTWTTRP